MGILCNVLALILILAHSVVADFNVRDYGAVGDGLADDTKAFSKAWSAACDSTEDTTTMIIPEGGTFRVKPLQFKGPCKSKNIIFQVNGGMAAPEHPNSWKDAKIWLDFHSVDHLTVRGGGALDGKGTKWWEKHCKRNPKPGCFKKAPSGVKFSFCNDLSVSDLKVRDSPFFHITLLSCQRVDMRNLDIVAPSHSPNTDGIHISRSQDVNIQESKIQTGDDCISVGDGVFRVNISHIECGPGHGISIGSLGKHWSQASVENILVSNVNFYGTSNGARIKTWQGGTGYVKAVKFENLTFDNVTHPIYIDQQYCDSSKPCPPEHDAVQISDVTFTYATGTSATNAAVRFNCSQPWSCMGIYVNDLNITSSGKTKALCANVHGEARGCISPKLSDCFST